MRRQVILASAAALLLAACSGDGGAAPSSSAEATSTSTSVATPETTAPPTTTTLPPTTSNPTTTVPAATAPPTTEATTTTTTSTMLPEGVPPRVTFPDDPEKQAVVDAVYAFSDLLFSAQADPTNEALRSKVDLLAGEPVRSRFISFLDRVASDGQAFVDSPGNPSYLEVLPEAVTVVDGSGLVDACAVDRTVQVEIGGNLDGSNRVIDDTVFSASQSYNVTRTDQVWRVVDFTVFEEWEGQVGCGD